MIHNAMAYIKTDTLALTHSDTYTKTTFKILSDIAGLDEVRKNVFLIFYHSHLIINYCYANICWFRRPVDHCSLFSIQLSSPFKHQPKNKTAQNVFIRATVFHI